MKINLYSNINMGNTHSINDKIRDFFNKDVKDAFGKIGSVAGKFFKFGQGMMENMMKMSNNMSNLMGSSIFPYILIGGVLIYVGFRTKML